MSAKTMTPLAIRRRTIAAMKSLGTYRTEYDMLIDIYSALVAQYDALLEEFMVSCDYTSETGDGGEKKSPIVASLEAMRKDILAYSDRLCLNPKTLKADAPKQKKKPSLAQMLSGQQ